MPSTLELCETYFGTRDIYKLMNLKKDANEKDVKKAYYRLSLQIHPDRVAESEKEEATEKFKVLTKINAVLTDSNAKALYDEQGIIDDDGEGECNWLKMWREFFKPITTTDIEKFHQSYIGSDMEERDVRKAYETGKGCINFMLNSVPFMQVEDEPRIIELVKGWIADGSVPEYEQFTNEPKAKRYRRHKRYGKEALEAAAIKRDMDKKNKSNGSLEQQLMKRQAERESNANSFFDHLLEKYGGADDSEEYEIPAKKKKKPAAAKTPSKAASKSTPSKAATKATKKVTATKTSPKSSPKAAMNKVKNGRVSKRK